MTNLPVELQPVAEDQLTPEQRSSVRQLLAASFPGFFADRIYYKQVPHFRVLAAQAGALLGQVAVEHRAVRVGDAPVRIFGVVDLCVAESARHRGVGAQLVEAVHERAIGAGIEHIVLFADDPRLYERLGYRRVDVDVTYLAIDEHRSLDLRTRSLADCMMVASPTGAAWPAGDIDMLGHVF